MESGLGGEREASTAVERTLKSRFDGRYRDVCSLSLSLSLSPKRRHFLSILNFSVL